MLRTEKISTGNESRRRGIGEVVFLVLLFFVASSAAIADGLESAPYASGLPHAEDHRDRGTPVSAPVGVVFAQFLAEFESDSDGEVDHAATIAGVRAEPVGSRGQSWPVHGLRCPAAHTATDLSRAPPLA